MAVTLASHSQGSGGSKVVCHHRHDHVCSPHEVSESPLTTVGSAGHTLYFGRPERFAWKQGPSPARTVRRGTRLPSAGTQAGPQPSPGPRLTPPCASAVWMLWLAKCSDVSYWASVVLLLLIIIHTGWQTLFLDRHSEMEANLSFTSGPDTQNVKVDTAG